MSRTKTQDGSVGSIQIPLIPISLLNRDQWVCWRSSGSKKPPINPATGGNANIKNHSTWTDFQTAVNRYYNDSTIDGIGFVLTPDDPFVGIDIDDCRNPETGELSDYASGIVDQFADKTYIEISPSGRGLHIILMGEHKISRSHINEVEIYDVSRYFTVTGDIHERSAEKVRNCQVSLRSVVNNCDFDTRSADADRPNPSLSHNKELVDTAKNALEQFEEVSPTAANEVTELLKGNPTDLDIPKKQNGKIDRSGANHIALTQLLGIISMHSDIEPDRRIQAASSLFTDYCRDHKSTYCGQDRRWLDDDCHANYRKYICEYAQNTFDILKFQRMYWRGSKSSQDKYGTLTRDTVYFGITLLIIATLAADRSDIEQYVRNSAKDYHISIEQLDKLVDYLNNYSPPNCLNVCTPPRGTDESIGDIGYPCADDVTEVVQYILPKRSSDYITNIMGRLQKEGSIKMAGLDRYDRYQCVYYPARLFPDVANAEFIRVGGDDYEPGSVPDQFY